MTKVGFIGLGIMGRPMAANLLRAGFELTVYSRRAESGRELVSQGARAAGSVREATEGQDVVITMLPDSPDVEQVVLGDDGVLASAAEGLLLLEMSTVAPATELAIAEAAGPRGVRVLDAPVSGGEPGAINAALSIMAGGSAEDFAAARPVFDALGKTVAHVGPAGAGQTVKAANQLLVGGILELVSEALLVVQAAGVDAEAAVKLLSGGLAGNRILDQKAAKMLAHEFAPGFRIDLHHKDMGIVLDLGRELNLPLPLAGAVAQLFTAARAQGLGQLDHSALLASLEHLAGTDGAANPNA